MYQEGSIEWQKGLIHLCSVIRLKIPAYLCNNCCKQQYTKEAVFWYNLNSKGIIIFPYDDKQFILLLSVGKIIPNYDKLE